MRKFRKLAEMVKNKIKEFKFPEISVQKKRILIIVSIALLLILVKFSSYLIHQYHSSSDAKKEIARVRDTYVRTDDGTQPSSQTPMPSPEPDIQLEEPSQEPSEEPDIDSLAEYDVPEKEIDFSALQKEVNSDIYAWITIPDTEIDYPLVQHPTDNAYYLHHNLDGSEGYPGCIYSERYNTTTLEDPNTILYGHNMIDGSMFAGLHGYEQEDFFEEHPYVYVYAPDSVNVYQIFAAYEYSDNHLFAVCDWDDSTAVTEYLARIPGCPGIFDQTVPVDTDSKLLTLSTCIKGKEDKRFLVQAVLVAQGNGQRP